MRIEGFVIGVGGERSKFLGLEEKLGEFVEGRFRHPTLGVLTALAGANQPGPGQFLEMVRNGGLADAQTPPQFAHAQAGTLRRAATMTLTATREAEKKR